MAGTCSDVDPCASRINQDPNCCQWSCSKRMCLGSRGFIKFTLYLLCLPGSKDSRHATATTWSLFISALSGVDDLTLDGRRRKKNKPILEDPLHFARLIRAWCFVSSWFAAVSINKLLLGLLSVLHRSESEFDWFCWHSCYDRTVWEPSLWKTGRLWMIYFWPLKTHIRL